MADSSERKQKSKSMKNNLKEKIKHKKRKIITSSENEKPNKIPCISEEFTHEKHPQVVDKIGEMAEEKTGGNYQWRNLELALSIQSKEIDSHKKVESIHEFVMSAACEKDVEADDEFNTLGSSRLTLYISNWIQTLLINSEKKSRSRDKDSEESEFCLDYRCWQILKYCLDESSRLHVSLSLSRDILRVISRVANCTLDQLSGVKTNSEISSFVTKQCHIFNAVNGCLKSLFNSHGLLLNGNLDLWTGTVTSLLELVIKTFAHNIQESDVGNLIVELSCLVFEHFSKFLKVHPCRKNGFRDFVEKLLEPLLHLLGMLPEQITDDGNPMMKHLFNFIQEIVSYGLFHIVHLDEYLSLHGTERYSSLADWKVFNARTSIKSYLRHLFDKLENLVSKRKVHALSGVGEMFQIFVHCVKKQRESHDSDGSQSTKDPSKIVNSTSEKSKTTSPGWNMRKSFFDFFVLTMEPLLLDLRKHLQSDLDSKTFVMDVNFALKAVNTILSTMVRERIYVRTEDNSGGACLSFFKVSYGLLQSCYANVNQFWNSNRGNDRLAQVEVSHSAAKEFALVIMSFLEIEYEVIGDDLGSTWLMILTFLAMGNPSGKSLEPCPLSSVAVDLGCRVVSLYSELRQVDLALFSLCRGLRDSVLNQVDNEMNSAEVLPSTFSLDGDKFAKSGFLLLSSQQFRLAICNAIKSIPEGQANEYIQTLSADISDSLEWMKFTCPMTDKHELVNSNFRQCRVKAEILGMVLSEIYSMVLDSIPVTTGNSYRTAVSVESVIKVLGPNMTVLVDPEQGGLDGFIFSVLGITSQSKRRNHKKDLHNEASLLVLFFFRLYVSSRSLYRQTLSLMPPKSIDKMTGMTADLCTAYSCDDLLKKSKSDEGYFSWIVLHSSSLRSMIDTLKDGILQKGSARFCLIYVMFIMIFQRLGDLKRQMQSVEYMVKRYENEISSKLVDDADISALRKKKRKQDKLLIRLKQEAVCLTEFITEYLYADDRQLQISWDLGVCTVDEKTLHTAVWWAMCQNFDTWCDHATKEHLKLFLSQLIYNSLPLESNGKFEDNSHEYSGAELDVTKCKISWNLLCDTNFYDQSFVCRHIISRICVVLKKLVPLVFEDSSNNDVDLSSSDWTEALRVLSNTPMGTRDKPATFYCIFGDVADKCCSKQESSSRFNLHLAAARSLLNLLSHMMRKALCFKPFSRCLIYLVNFERLIVGSFIDPHGKLCLHEQFELLQLLVSCRKTLRRLLTTFCESSEAYKSSSLGIFSNCTSPYLWLLKSLNVVVGWSNLTSFDYNNSQVSSIIASLMDQTSYVFFAICKRDFREAVHCALNPKVTKVSSLKSSKDDTKGCKSLAMIVEGLEVEIKSLFPFLTEALNNGNVETLAPLADLNKLSSVLSCVQGSLWGLECALSDVGTNYKELKSKLKKHNYETLSRIINFLDTVVKFIGISSLLFLCTNQSVENSCDENRSHCLVEFGSFDYNCLRVDMLQSFLDGQNLDAAYFLRRILISSSAVMRLSTEIKCSSLSSKTVQILLGCSEFLLTKFSNILGTPKSSSFLWLDGTVQFLEALGSQFPLTDPSTTKDIYAKLVELNIKAIGKCIYLQGKQATLASHDIESVTKLLATSQVLDPSVVDPLYNLGLDDLKTRLRKSFKVLIEKPSELHLLSVMQALQQALTGIRVESTTICDIQMGITDEGVVSSVVAAGVDCLDLLIESLKGNKLWNTVKMQLNGIIASLFNIVVHLQGPTLFHERPNNTAMNNSPDSGSVALMCVEVLTRIAGKPALFHLDFRHVTQSLHLPGTLFQSFRGLKTSQASEKKFPVPKDSNEYSHIHVDRKFSINLYAASCRLLWTVVKHHKSDCVRCVFLLQASLQVLLHCMEQISTDTTDGKGYFTWDVEEGVKCATYLRRVYEEIRQQKDKFGQHAYKFLSDYVWVSSGFGSLKHGLKREIDEALRPGVYSLIDVCSPDDLQHLHTVFGEGPRRSTLASLKHDYEHNFKYGGKV